MDYENKYYDYCRTKGDRKRHPNKIICQRELKFNKIPEWFSNKFENSSTNAKTKRNRQRLINNLERRRTKGRIVARRSNKQATFIQ